MDGTIRGPARVSNVMLRVVKGKPAIIKGKKVIRWIVVQVKK